MWRLANPLFLLFLLFPLALMIWHFWSHRRGRASLLFSGGSYLHGLPRSWRAIVSPQIHWLRYLGLALLTIALTRPQSGSVEQDIKTYGVDIMLVLDVSGTMAEADMIEGNRAITRLAAARKVMEGFIKGRSSDRLGLIAFASQSLTRCPLTVDYDLLSLALRETNLDLFPEEQRATAIGNALATAVARLHKSDAKSRVVILLTDGANNAGNVTPQGAAEIAASEGIRVYTIGFGSPGRTDVDESNLQDLARMTGGQFFRSKSLRQLEEVYGRIDELEKSEVVVKNFEIWDELFPWFLWSGCLIMLLEVVLGQIVCRRVP